jgi:hypothetical protein
VPVIDRVRPRLRGASGLAGGHRRAGSGGDT